ncbi:MAG: hypothetical protein O3B87_02150, partial [bacterium]|nr:hypothetical protein [bacterium]
MRTPNKYILTRKPKEYLKQGAVHCGVYTAKAVLEAYGKGIHSDPRKYHVAVFNRITGTMIRLADFSNILIDYGLEVEGKFMDKQSNQQKIEVLKNILSQNIPVPITIGNGYSYKNGSINYSALRGLVVGHIVSIWGYDDYEQVFYIYDSVVPKEYYSKDIPIGNIKRPYKDFLRDWNGSIYCKFF